MHLCSRKSHGQAVVAQAESCVVLWAGYRAGPGLPRLPSSRAGGDGHLAGTTRGLGGRLGSRECTEVLRTSTGRGDARGKTLRSSQLALSVLSWVTRSSATYDKFRILIFFCMILALGNSELSSGVGLLQILSPHLSAAEGKPSGFNGASLSSRWTGWKGHPTYGSDETTWPLSAMPSWGHCSWEAMFPAVLLRLRICRLKAAVSGPPSSLLVPALSVRLLGVFSWFEQVGTVALGFSKALTQQAASLWPGMRLLLRFSSPAFPGPRSALPCCELMVKWPWTCATGTV